MTQGVVADGFIRTIVVSPWRLFRHIQDYGFSYDKTTPVVDGEPTCEPGAPGCNIKVWKRGLNCSLESEDPERHLGNRAVPT